MNSGAVTAAGKLSDFAVLAIGAAAFIDTPQRLADLAGFLVACASALLGKSRLFQIIILFLAATLGWAAITQLPVVEYQPAAIETITAIT